MGYESFRFVAIIKLMIMIRRPRQLIAIALAVTLFAVALLLAALVGTRAVAASILSELPAPIRYDKLGLTIFPLGVELTGARAASLAGLPIDKTTAAEIRVSLSPRGALALAKGQRSLPTLFQALRSFEAVDVATRVQLSSHTAAVETRGVTIVGPRDGTPLSIESPGFDITFSDTRAAPAAYLERPERDSQTDRQEKTIAERLERILGSAVTVSERVPQLSLTLGPTIITLDNENVTFSGKLTIGNGEPVAGTLTIAELPLTLLDRSGGASIAGGRLSGELELTVESGTSASLGGTLTAEGVSVADERIAEELIAPPRLGYDFNAKVDTTTSVPPPRLAMRVPGTEDPAPIGAGAPEDQNLRGKLSVTEGTLRVGSVELQALPVLWGLNAPSGELPMPLPVRLDLDVSLPETQLQEIVDSIPDSILGPLNEIELEGSLAWSTSLEAPLHRLSWTWWEETTRVEGFRIVRIDPAYDVRNLSGAFRHRLGIGESGRGRLVTVPPPGGGGGYESSEDLPLLGAESAAGRRDPNYRFVPYQEIAPTFIGAVITAEDGEYFRHNGVNWRALTYAAQRNLMEGEIVVGGSTIPMQLAKNLFLDGDRVIARKVQELGLVALANLSEAASRERMLEVYLNIIEFGSGIYGVANAAAHYFETTPANLTVEQSVWLASIIRSPRFLSRHAETGSVPPYWLQRMEGIMELMVERGRLSEEELEAARRTQPQFKKSG